MSHEYILTYIYIAYAIVVPSLILNVQVIKLAHWLRRQRILRIIQILVIDWFAYTPRWLGAYPTIWLLYILGVFDLLPYFHGKLAYFSTGFTLPVSVVALLFIVAGGFVKRNDIRERFTNADVEIIRTRICIYLMLEVLAGGYALVFGPVGLWSFLIHDESIQIELILASLIAPNLISIIARASIRESAIAEYFLHAIGK